MIQVKNLVKSYGSFQAVRGIDFSVKKGEIVGILGLNGAGKSSTIRAICGFFSFTQGSICIDDQVLEKGRVNVAAKEMMGYLPESAPLYKEMMVYDYLHFVWMLRKGGMVKNAKKRREMVQKRIAEVCEICSIDEVKHKNIEDLSKGYRQRVGLAGTLIGDPEILVLDEPTSGLDPNQIRAMRSLIKKVAETKTILICSHILPEVEATCDRVIIIQNGLIVVDDKMEHLRRSHGRLRIFVGLCDVDFDHVAKVFRRELPGIEVEKADSENEKNVVGFLLSCADHSDTEGGAKGTAEKKDLRLDIFECIKKNGWPLVSFYQKMETLDTIFRQLTHSPSEKV